MKKIKRIKKIIKKKLNKDKIDKWMENKKAKITKHFKNKTKNIRFETRYNNSLKKIESLEEEVRNLNDQLNENENVKKIKDLKEQLKRYKNMVSNLRKDIEAYESKLSEKTDIETCKCEVKDIEEE